MDECLVLSSQHACTAKMFIFLSYIVDIVIILIIK